MGSIWGRVIPAICLNPMFFMKQFWVGSISKMDCFRILIWPINNSGFLLVFWWFLWFGTAAKWFTSWLIYSKSWLMNVGRHSRSFFFSCLLSWFQWIMNALCFTFFFFVSLSLCTFENWSLIGRFCVFYSLCCLISTFWFWSDVWILKFWNIMSWSWCLWICHGDENH